jgi:hypothetical protein
MKKRLFVFTVILFCNLCMMGSDSCKVTVNVKIPPVSFATDGNGAKGATADIAPGQSFQIFVSYQDGKAPYTCTIANAPSWMKVDAVGVNDVCTVSGTVPSKNPDGTTFEGSFTADLTVTDASGTSAKLSLGSKAPTPGT